MNRKISEKIIYPFLIWFYAVIFAGFLYCLVIRPYEYLVYPWLLAGGVTIDEGIYEFSGRFTENSLWLKEHYYSLIAIIIGFVIGPTFFMMGWRSLQMKKISPRGAATLSFIVGGAITLAVAVPAVPLAVQHYENWEVMKNHAAAVRHKDEIIGALYTVRFDALTYWMKPSVRGGGHHSFGGYKIPDTVNDHDEYHIEITSTENACIKLKAVSSMYPLSSVVATVDSSGTISLSNVEGVFQ